MYGQSFYICRSIFINKIFLQGCANYTRFKAYVLKTSYLFSLLHLVVPLSAKTYLRLH